MFAGRFLELATLVEVGDTERDNVRIRFCLDVVLARPLRVERPHSWVDTGVVIHAGIAAVPGIPMILE